MDWHARYVEQARWTEQLRGYLFKKAGLEQAGRLLEVGCGTGAVMAGLPNSVAIHGLDIDPLILNKANRYVPRAFLTVGDGAQLPYARSVFDLAYCHFLLLWAIDPLQVLVEMRRVVRPGGAVLALAEPDYGGRIDYPTELEETGLWQVEGLKRRGADTELGRKLADMFHSTGLRQVHCGVLGGEWQSGLENEDQKLEWQVLIEDLGDSVPASRLQDLEILDQQARKRGERILFVPTFFAWGIV